MRETSKPDYWILLNEEAEPEAELRPGKKMRSQRQKLTVYDAQMRKMLAEELQKEENEFQMTYKAARHEHAWLSAALNPFFQDNLISDVLHKVRGGKEANVYCCRAHPALNLSPNPFPSREGEIPSSGNEFSRETPPSLQGKGEGGIGLLAAKIYRPLNRNMKNDSLYKEGRAFIGDDGKALRDHRSLRAIQRKTRKGMEMTVTSWIEYEYQTMQMLYEAGGSVPRPVAQSGNAILMDYIGEVAAPAPILVSVSLDREEARHLFDVLMRNVEIMLAHNRIHADLSAYNVLYWEGRVVIIDFPQVVDPVLNERGYALLTRDIHRLCQYFNRYGLHVDAARMATDLWSRYIRGEFNKE